MDLPAVLMVGSGDCESQVQLTARSEVHNQELHLIILAVGSWYLLAATSVFLLSLLFLFSAALLPKQLCLLKELCPFLSFFFSSFFRLKMEIWYYIGAPKCCLFLLVDSLGAQLPAPK